MLNITKAMFMGSFSGYDPKTAHHVVQMGVLHVVAVPKEYLLFSC